MGKRARMAPLQKQIQEAAAVLRKFGATEVYLFGSAAEGRLHRHSDIDMAVGGLPSEKFLKAYGRAAHCILRRELDLVNLDWECPLTQFLRSHGDLLHDVQQIAFRKEYDFTGAKRGAIDPTPPGKTRVTISLDNKVLLWFRDLANRQGGGNYQSMINDALLEYVCRQKESLEDMLRRVFREELKRRTA